MNLSEHLNRIEAAERQLAEAQAALWQELAVICKQIRLDNGWTQEQLAGMLGVQNTYISRIEHGRSRPGMDLLRQLARSGDHHAGGEAG